ncbi:MAG: hypothetical protein GEU26_00235 [Nitrososphaeraceae archaeon]|nr:hypothetical protein [Nitrososphaeraceae archaeon]
MEYDSICLQDAEILRIAKKIVTVREISMGSYVGLEKKSRRNSAFGRQQDFRSSLTISSISNSGFKALIFRIR